MANKNKIKQQLEFKFYFCILDDLHIALPVSPRRSLSSYKNVILCRHPLLSLFRSTFCSDDIHGTLFLSMAISFSLLNSLSLSLSLSHTHTCITHTLLDIQYLIPFVCISMYFLTHFAQLYKKKNIYKISPVEIHLFSFTCTKYCCHSF